MTSVIGIRADGCAAGEHTAFASNRRHCPAFALLAALIASTIQPPPSGWFRRCPITA